MLGKQEGHHLPVTSPAAGVRTPLCAFTAVLQKIEPYALGPSCYRSVGDENYIVETSIHPNTEVTLETQYVHHISIIIQHIDGSN